MPRLECTAFCFACLLGLTGCTDGSGTSPFPTSSPPSATLAAGDPASPPDNPREETPTAPAESSVAKNSTGDRTGDSASEGTATGPAQTSAEAQGYAPAANLSNPAGTVPELPQTRTFRPEGSEQALRITYDDLDLLKWLKLDPVTPECIETMPVWMRELNGKKVRLRGFMKPHEISTGFRRFIFVKDTGLCCFGPAGKIYDLIQVTLQKGTTTDYIELTPFDVIGTFRIEIAFLDDTREVYELFHIDDARIVRK